MHHGLTSATINSSIGTPYIEHGCKKINFSIEASLYAAFVTDGIAAEALSLCFQY
jgi:hypothetical protein